MTSKLTSIPALTLALTLSGCMQVIPAMAPALDVEENISAEFPYASKYVDVLDSRMHYVDIGSPDEPPIVLLHGNPTSSYLWRNVIPHLEEYGRVIAPDLIGMGRSGKPDITYRMEDQVRYLDAFVDELQLNDVVFVLHDWGGGVGFDHAMRHEGNVRGIAFFETLVMPQRWSDMSAPERWMFGNLRGSAGDSLILDDNYFIETLMPAMSGRTLTEEEMARYREPFESREARKPLRAFPQEVPFEDGEEPGPADNLARMKGTYEALQASDAPLLLLTFEPGALIKGDVVDRLRSADLPRLETADGGAGLHFVQESQPTAIGTEVATWVQTLPAWEGAVRGRLAPSR